MTWPGGHVGEITFDRGVTTISVAGMDMTFRDVRPCSVCDSTLMILQAPLPESVECVCSKCAGGVQQVKRGTVSQDEWRERFSVTHLGLIALAGSYEMDGMAGLPGHNLMLIVAKMAKLLDEAEAGGFVSAMGVHADHV